MRHRLRRHAGAWGVALALLASTSARSADETFHVDEARPGQRGYGISVFAGAEPERFEIEVVGVLRNVAPGTSYLLARLSGHDLERTGVVAGMSGSPVWIDGRLAGAVSFGFTFGKDPLAGITPIDTMRAIPGGAASDAQAVAPRSAGPRLALVDLAALRLPADLADRELAALATAASRPGGGAPALLWTASGFPIASRARLEQALAPLGAFGSGGSGAPVGELRDGSAVAGVLVDGDLQIAATGTVTERRGNELLAFGHPFIGLGATALPMATAEIITVVASQASSFKLSNTGPVVGALVFDQSAGVRGRIGAAAPMLPLVVRVGGPAGRTVAVRIAQVSRFLPALIAASAVGALDVAAAVAAESVDAEPRLVFADGRELRMAQSFDGAAPAKEMVDWLVAVTSYLTTNPLADASLERAELAVEPFAAPRAAALLAVRPDRALVRAGEHLGIEVTLAPFRGAAERRRVEITLPADLPAGRYSLLVGDGASIDGAQLEAEPVDPTTLDQALAVLGSLSTRRELSVLGLLPARGVASPGETLPRLPGTWQSLRGLVAGRTDERPLRLAVAQRVRVPLAAPLVGMARVELEVRRPSVLVGKEKP